MFNPWRAFRYASVLLSIESILDNHPIHHEPGYEQQLGTVDTTSRGGGVGRTS